MQLYPYLWERPYKSPDLEDETKEFRNDHKHRLSCARARYRRKRKKRKKR